MMERLSVLIEQNLQWHAAAPFDVDVDAGRLAPAVVGDQHVLPLVAA